MFDVKLYLDESLLAEIEYQKFVVQNSIKVSSMEFEALIFSLTFGFTRLIP